MKMISDWQSFSGFSHPDPTGIALLRLESVDPGEYFTVTGERIAGATQCWSLYLDGGQHPYAFIDNDEYPEVVLFELHKLGFRVSVRDKYNGCGDWFILTDHAAR